MELIYQGIDTAAKISARAAKALRENGISFVCRYLVPDKGNTAWKALTASEAQEIRKAGLSLMLVWEITGDRVKGGLDVGKVDGATARQLAEEMRVPINTAIFFAADYNVPESDFSAVYDYLYGASISCAPYPIGLYGHEKIVHEMAARKVCWYFWQCCAWSTNALDPAAQVWQYQWQGGDDAKALASKVGFAVDLDSAGTFDGMWRPEAQSTEEEDAMRWARKMGIVTDEMKDVTQTALMLWRYHRIYSAEDYKAGSGLLE